MEIKLLENQTDWKEAFSVMKQLRTHLSEDAYLQLVEEAAEKEHYQMAALYDNGKIVAVTGFMPMITLYNGRSVWVSDLVTDGENRSKGYGQVLLEFVHTWSKENGYDLVSLSSGVQRVDAHRFYEDKMEYDRVSHVFLKKL